MSPENDAEGSCALSEPVGRVLRQRLSAFLARVHPALTARRIGVACATPGAVCGCTWFSHTFLHLGSSALTIAAGGGLVACLAVQGLRWLTVPAVAGILLAIMLVPHHAAALGVELLSAIGAAACLHGISCLDHPAGRAFRPLLLALVCGALAVPLSLVLHVSGGSLWLLSCGAGTLVASPLADLLVSWVRPDQQKASDSDLLSSPSRRPALRPASPSGPSSAPPLPSRLRDGYARPPEEGGLSAVSSLAGLSVLVVDDDAVNRLVASEILLAAGHQARAVSSGESSLALLKQQPFDVVLMDFHMPGMNGAETIRRLRTLDHHEAAAIGVAMLSADTSAEARSIALEAGADAFISKPFETTNLLLTLEACVAARQERLKGTGAEAATAPPSHSSRQARHGDACPADEMEDENSSGLDGRLLDNLLLTLGEASLCRLLSLYCSSVPRRVETVRAFLRHGQPDPAARELKILAGVARVIGANKVCDSALALEQTCSKRNLGSSTGLLSALEAANRQTMAAIQDFLSRHHLSLSAAATTSGAPPEGENG